MAFSHRSLNALRPKTQPYRVYEGASDKGFCVQVTRTGTKIFEQQYTLIGRRRFLRLGTYTSLNDARIRARAARKLIEQGIDSQETTQGVARIKGSVNQLFDGYLAQMTRDGKRSVKETARSLERDARPLMGTLLAKDITPGDIRDVLYRVVQRFEEFDRDARVWVLPPERTKNKRYHLVPLTELALAIFERLTCLNSLQGPYLFPARGEPPRPQNKSTLPQAILAYCRVSGLLPWTPKDLRRTVKTRMGEVGIQKSIRDRVQNHALVDVSTKHYDRYDYLSEKREALETWCSHLHRIVS